MAGDANVGQYLDRGPLTLQGATLYFDFGAGGANAVLDNLAASGAASISGSNTIDLIGFGSTAPTAGTYNLITAASGLGTGTFLLGTTSLVEGGTTYNFSLVRTATVVELAVTAKPPRSP
jgi:hypothetical protein